MVAENRSGFSRDLSVRLENLLIYLLIFGWGSQLVGKMIGRQKIRLEKVERLGEVLQEAAIFSQGRKSLDFVSRGDGGVQIPAAALLHQKLHRRKKRNSWRIPGSKYL